jgi:hypothetical protein
MSQFITITQLRKMLRQKGEVNLKFWKSDGSIVIAKNVIIVSTRYRPETVTVKFVKSGQIRTINIVTIFEINDIEVFI